jgi:hypothetical protein
LRPAVLLWLVLAPLACAPYLHAMKRPPAGRAFSGAFRFQDDHQQYLSFVEQASRGAVLFVNKYDPRPHEPFLLNLTWWAGGALARPLGHDPRLGFLLLGVVALLALLVGAERFLRRGGLRGTPLLWALALFATGGGLGWLRTWMGAPSWQVPDVGMCLFPWSQAIVGAHGLVGTALLLLGLERYLAWREGGARGPWLLCAGLLGVTRPYDLLVFLAVVAGFSARDLAAGRTRQALAPALEMTWLLPVLLYDALVFVAHPAFNPYTSAQNEVPMPRLVEMASALGPAVLLGALGRAPGAKTDAGRLAAWGTAALIAALVVVRLPFALQLGNALGALLLLWAGLAVPARRLPWAVLALCPTALLLLWQILRPPAVWFLPRDYEAAAVTLARHCRAGDMVLGPVDPSLVIAGRSPCGALLGHRVATPDMDRRADEARRFYAAGTDVAWRLRLLRDLAPAFVLMPPGRGEWIRGSGYEPLLALPTLEVYRSPGRG